MGNIFPMITKFEPGSKVSVKDYSGKLLIRYVVADIGRKIIVCNENEYLACRAQGKKPEGIGFPRSDVRPVENMS